MELSLGSAMPPNWLPSVPVFERNELAKKCRDRRHVAFE